MTHFVPDRSDRPKRLRENGSRAFDLSITVIRTAQGKINPDDCEVGSPEWQEAQVGVMRDSMRLSDLHRRAQRLATTNRLADAEGFDL
jgi:hypothetical protein